METNKVYDFFNLSSYWGVAGTQNNMLCTTVTQKNNGGYTFPGSQFKTLAQFFLYQIFHLSSVLSNNKGNKEGKSELTKIMYMLLLLKMKKTPRIERGGISYAQIISLIRIVYYLFARCSQ